jgi:hypothetical protein
MVSAAIKQTKPIDVSLVKWIRNRGQGGHGIEINVILLLGKKNQKHDFESMISPLKAIYLQSKLQWPQTQI